MSCEEINILSHSSEPLIDANSAEKAEAQKNRLLEYDRTSEKRTKVIDDESDYFSTDGYKWMNAEQKKKLKEREEELNQKRHGSRLDRKIDFDFAHQFYSTRNTSNSSQGSGPSEGESNNL